MYRPCQVNRVAKLPRSATVLVLIGLFAAILTIVAPPPQTVYAATFVVTKTDDTNDGVCDTDCSLQEAITAANALPDADAITVPVGTYVLGPALGIFEPVSITGAVSAFTIQNGRAQNLGAGAWIHVNNAHTLNLTDMVVTNNHATGSSGGRLR
jgi:CSLREA domain-containing protein